MHVSLKVTKIGARKNDKLELYSAQEDGGAGPVQRFGSIILATA